MDRGAGTRWRGTLLPQPTKMPVASKQAKKEELNSRPKLAPLDSNCRTTRQRESRKPAAKVLPKALPQGLERKVTTSTTTTTAGTLARRQPVGREHEPTAPQSTVARRKVATTEQEAVTNTEAKAPNHEGSSRHHPRLSQQDHTATRNTRTSRKQPLKDCHSLLPDNIKDLNTLPPLCSDQDLIDPQQCEEYAQDIYQNLLQAEREDIFKITSDLMCRQREAEGNHRRVLIDWLVQVHTRYSLLPDTLHISLDILDRYLQVNTLQIQAFFKGHSFSQAIHLTIFHYLPTACQCAQERPPASRSDRPLHRLQIRRDLPKQCL